MTMTMTNQPGSFAPQMVLEVAFHDSPLPYMLLPNQPESVFEHQNEMVLDDFSNPWHPTRYVCNPFASQMVLEYLAPFDRVPPLLNQPDYVCAPLHKMQVFW